jgi:hypothetical protein
MEGWGMSIAVDFRLLAARKPLEQLKRELSLAEGADTDERALLGQWEALVSAALDALDRAQTENDLA